MISDISLLTFIPEICAISSKLSLKTEDKGIEYCFALGIMFLNSVEKLLLKSASFLLIPMCNKLLIREYETFSVKME